MGRGYSHLTPNEREEISRGLALGASFHAIAQRLGRSKGTVCREVARNAPDRDGYRSVEAGSAAHQRASRPRRPRKLGPGPLWARVISLLRLGWSPEQVAGRLRRDYPDDMSMRASHETIYLALYIMPRGGLRRELLALLRRGHKTRHPRGRGADRRGKIPDMVSIHERPQEAEDRRVPGHWEGDLIKGARNASAVGTLVERTTRLVLLARLDGATAHEARLGFQRRLRRVPQPLRKSLTYDQGKEMAEHTALSENLRIRVFFADPHSPWQRGTMENTNGLLRQYLPKGEDLSQFSQRDLNTIAERLNTRPRKTLDFATPLEAFHLLLENPGVALGP